MANVAKTGRPLSLTIEAAQPQELAAALKRDRTSYEGPSISFGIMRAGAAYPVVLASLWLALFVGAITWSWIEGHPIQISIDQIVEALVIAAMSVVAAAFFGIVWAAIAAALTLPVVYAFVRSLKLRGDLLHIGAVCGGLVGFMTVGPSLAILFEIGSVEPWNICLVLLMGPGLATIVGQLGGAWGAQRAVHYSDAYYRFAVARASADRPTSTQTVNDESRTQIVDEEVADSLGSHEPQIQFRIYHLLWLFVWLSLLMSAIRLSALRFEFVLPLVVGWIFFQYAALAAGSYLLRRLIPWWTARRQRRST